jgi:hypothetical protein
MHDLKSMSAITWKWNNFGQSLFPQSAPEKKGSDSRDESDPFSFLLLLREEDLEVADSAEKVSEGPVFVAQPVLAVWFF